MAILKLAAVIVAAFVAAFAAAGTNLGHLDATSAIVLAVSCAFFIIANAASCSLTLASIIMLFKSNLDVVEDDLIAENQFRANWQEETSSAYSGMLRRQV